MSLVFKNRSFILVRTSSVSSIRMGVAILNASQREFKFIDLFVKCSRIEVLKVK